MMMIFWIISLLAIPFDRISAQKELPSDLKRCKFGPEYRQCMIDAINDALPKVVTRYKELGLSKLEPFVIKFLKFEQQGNRPVNLKQEFHNLVMPRFISGTVVKDFNLDLDKHEIEFAYQKDILLMEGDYSMSGRMLILPIEGHGKCSIKFIDLDMSQKLKFVVKEKDGAEYWHFTSVESFMRPKKLEMNFENLFNGDKQLSETTNRFMNENWRDIFFELGPEYSKAFSEISLKVLNKFFDQFPMKNILLR